MGEGKPVSGGESYPAAVKLFCWEPGRGPKVGESSALQNFGFSIWKWHVFGGFWSRRWGQNGYFWQWEHGPCRNTAATAISARLAQRKKNCDYCLSNAMYSSIGQNIKSSAVSDVRCPTHLCVCVRDLSRAQFLTDFDEIWHKRLEPKSRHEPWKISRKGGVVRVTWPFFLGVKCQQLQNG